MIRAITISAIILFVISGCKQNDSNELVTIDVTANYPEKELILQNFMDVEYVPLETNDDFVCQGRLQDVGEKFIIVRNNINDGDIFIFDRTGKAIKKINRKGKGGEEYTGILGVTLDEDNSELFVNDNSSRKIIVYDLDGNFKRSFRHKESMMYGEVYNFDKENLICHDVRNENYGGMTLINKGQSFLIISKKDGNITKEIPIPFKEKKTALLKFKDEASGQVYVFLPSNTNPLIPYFENWMLTEVSADTLYSYSKNYQLMPIIVRTPSVHSMDPEVFLFLSMLTDRYYFMETVKRGKQFKVTDLLFDKKEKAIFRYTVYNNDYSNKEQVFLKEPVNNLIPSGQVLEAHQLVEDYEKGRLKGRLKEIAATLDEESNPVIMLIKHKK